MKKGQKYYRSLIASKDILSVKNECNSLNLLCANIIIYAVADWRLLIARKAWLKEPRAGCNFDELRAFFNSEWCEFIMQNFEIEPARILEVLETELQQAMAAKPAAKKTYIRFRPKKE